MSSRILCCLVVVAAVASLGAGQPPVPFSGQPGGPELSPPPIVPADPPPSVKIFPEPPPLIEEALALPNPIPGARFSFKIDPKTPVKELLPVAPKMVVLTGPVVTDDLKKVPELMFQAPAAKATRPEKLTEQTAHQIAKINFANAKKTDAFMDALLAERSDLVGLPWAMGDHCRTTGDRVKYFTEAASLVKSAMAGQQIFFTPPIGMSGPGGPGGPGGGQFGGRGFEPQVLLQGSQAFWQRYQQLCDQTDSSRGTTLDKDACELVTLARLAALTQMLAAEPAEVRLGLVKYAAGVSHIEATRVLARMAIYSPEEQIRDAAIAALKVRKEKDYTDILVKGLRYPWPAVAKRAADAIVKLERKDLIPELIAVLEGDDPRMPVATEQNGKKTRVVREMVKVNHHRNCLLCHAPHGSGVQNPNALLAEVPVQGVPLPAPSQGYQQTTPDLMVRLDVTYLRQDFSASLPVGEAHPWPEMQRFDFFVRERSITDEREVTAYRDALTPKEPGVLTPYQKAAVTALRELTGKDAAPTAEAWRKLTTPASAPR